jgi:hypothetical protein
MRQVAATFSFAKRTGRKVGKYQVKILIYTIIYNRKLKSDQKWLLREIK